MALEEEDEEVEVEV